MPARRVFLSPFRVRGAAGGASTGIPSIAGGSTTCKMEQAFRHTKHAVDPAYNNITMQLCNYYFRCIRGWTLDAMASLNRVHKDEISSILATPFRGPTVVVTHHLPSRELCHPRFASALSGGFASDCDALMKGLHAPVLWIHVKKTPKRI